ncbi:MAG: NTP transferase domain-containing protein [Firmicutes bacterium]|nr:NTP transferase domain-containing protein [Bacillota bacterium]
MDVIVLAGAKNDGPLRAVSQSPFEAGIAVGGRSLLDYVVGSLARVRGLDRVVVVGPPETLTPELRKVVWRIVSPGEGMVENLRRGLAALAPQDKVLVITADIPLITPEAIEDFLARCREREADVYYPVVERETIEARFPGAKRTYANLREGTFTGGNIILLSPAVFARHEKTIELAVALRKNTFGMARLLGLFCLFKLLLGRLSITEIERRVEKTMRFKGAAVVTPYAEIGIDVDKPSDLALVRKVLSASAPG